MQPTSVFPLALTVLAAVPVAIAHGPDKPSVASMPPVVVRTVPQAGETGVDPAVSEIRVTFSKAMKTEKMWSFVREGKDTFPKTTGQPRYLDDKRTIVLPVKLEPGGTYVLWINKGKFNAFRDVQGHPAVPYLLVFETKS